MWPRFLVMLIIGRVLQFFWYRSSFLLSHGAYSSSRMLIIDPTYELRWQDGVVAEESGHPLSRHLLQMRLSQDLKA